MGGGRRGRRGWQWRSAVVDPPFLARQVRGYVVQVSLYRSSPSVVSSGYTFSGDTELPTEEESSRGHSSQGHKAGLFAVRKPEEQAAPFYFPVSFKASCLPSRVSEHEVDVGFNELALASRGIAPDACRLKFRDARYSLASGLMPWNISPTCLGTLGSTRAFAHPATKSELARTRQVS